MKGVQLRCSERMQDLGNEGWSELFTGLPPKDLQWDDLYGDMREAVAQRVPLGDLVRVAPVSKELCSASRTRLDEAVNRVLSGYSSSSWNEPFVSELGLVISRFLARRDMLTGRSDIEFPFVSIDREGGLSLSNFPPAEGAFASKDPLNIERLDIQVYGAEKPGARITVGRGPSPRVVILVAGACGWQRPALSVAVLASINRHGSEPHKEQGVALNPLQDDVLAGSFLLSRQFEVGSILVFHQVGATRKIVRQRFKQKWSVTRRVEG